MKKIVTDIVTLASELLNDYFEAGRVCFDEHAEDTSLATFLVEQLFMDCHSSSLSSLLLTAAGKEWDADIINRSVMEGTMKYVFLMHGPPDVIARKAEEYWNTMPNFVVIRHHERVQSMLQALEDPDAPQWLPFKELLLTDEEVAKRRAGTTKKERAAIEQKWTFLEMAKSFVTSGDPTLAPLVHLAHGYGMSSHLIHKDGDGVGMVWERTARPIQRRLAAKIGHSARLASDSIAFASLRLHFLLRYCGRDTGLVKSIEGRHKDLFLKLDEAQRHFTSVEYGI